MKSICKEEYRNVVIDEPNLHNLTNLIIRGGWPGSLELKEPGHTILSREYLNAVINHDIYRLEGINRDAKLFHYQDYDGDEVDAIIELDDGNWVAIEIKLGSNEIEEAAGLLRKIKEKISKNGGKPPKVLCVVCGICKAAYLRDDGVYVVPITALKD